LKLRITNQAGKILIARGLLTAEQLKTAISMEEIWNAISINKGGGAAKLEG
jgi:hypothetical protein